MMFRPYLFIIALIIFSIGKTQGQNCGELQDGQEIRLDSPGKPMEGVRPWNQDNTGLCTYYSIGQILGQQINDPTNRQINPNYLGVLGYQIDPSRPNNLNVYVERNAPGSDDDDEFYNGARLCETLDQLRGQPICLHSQDDSVNTRNFADITDGLDSLHSQLTNLTQEQKDALDNALLEIAGYDKCTEMPSPEKIARSIDKLKRKINISKKIHLGELASKGLRTNVTEELNILDQLRNQKDQRIPQIVEEIKKQQSEQEQSQQLIQKLKEERSNLYESLAEIELAIKDLDHFFILPRQIKKIVDNLSSSLAEQNPPTKKKELLSFFREKKSQFEGRLSSIDDEISGLQGRIQEITDQMEILNREKAMVIASVNTQEQKYQEANETALRGALSSPQGKMISAGYDSVIDNLGEKVSQFTGPLTISCEQVDQELDFDSIKRLEELQLIRDFEIYYLENTQVDCPEKYAEIKNEIERENPSLQKIIRSYKRCSRETRSFSPKNDLRHSDWIKISRDEIKESCKAHQENYKNFMKECLIGEIENFGEIFNSCPPLFDQSDSLIELTKSNAMSVIDSINKTAESFLEIQFPNCISSNNQTTLPSGSCTPEGFSGRISSRIRKAKSIVSAELKADRPMGVSYCATQLYYTSAQDMIINKKYNQDGLNGQDSCGNHSSVIMGMKCVEGKASYLILNSYGNSLDPYSNRNVSAGTTRRAGDAEIPSYGMFWITEEEFAKITYEVQKVR